MPNYKISGAKFTSMDELTSSLWEIYKNKMSQEEFEKFIQENTEEV